MGSVSRFTIALRRRDQVVVAVATGVFWIVLVTNWIVKGGARGQLVDIEKAESRPVQFLVDVNQAEWPEFALLPGIGRMKAQRIVELRSRKGRFRHLDELLEVRGIGPKTMAAIRPFLCVVALK